MEVTFASRPGHLSLGTITCPPVRFTKEDINPFLQHKFGITVINSWKEIRQNLRQK
jgi:hypothetical protein